MKMPELSDGEFIIPLFTLDTLLLPEDQNDDEYLSRGINKC